MAGSVIDLKPIASAERQPLVVERCAIIHCNRFGVEFESPAIGQFERAHPGRRVRGEQHPFEWRRAYFRVPWIEMRGRQVAVAVSNRFDSRLVRETLYFYAWRKFETGLL